MPDPSRKTEIPWRPFHPNPIGSSSPWEIESMFWGGPPGEMGLTNLSYFTAREKSEEELGSPHLHALVCVKGWWSCGSQYTGCQQPSQFPLLVIPSAHTHTNLKTRKLRKSLPGAPVVPKPLQPCLSTGAHWSLTLPYFQV